MANLTVYLAGPVRGPNATWRQDFIDLVHTEFASPEFTHPGHNIPGASSDREANAQTDLYVLGDLLAVRSCDVVVAFLRSHEKGRGTSFELGMAYALSKAILLIAETEEEMWDWRFATAAVPDVYRSMQRAADALTYVADQLGGARYDPSRPG